MMHTIHTRRLGQFEANIATIRFCLRRNHKLILGCSNQQAKIEELYKYFPTALFVLVGDWGVEIKIRDRKELE